MRKLFIAALVLVPVSAQASNWVSIGSASDGTKVSYDSDSLKRTGSVVTVWVMYDLSRVKAERARSERVMMDVNCDNRTSRNTYTITYYPDGRNVSRDGKYSSFQPTAPDTLGEVIHEAVCEPTVDELTASDAQP